jgi:hypothetical protein
MMNGLAERYVGNEDRGVVSRGLGINLAVARAAERNQLRCRGFKVTFLTPAAVLQIAVGKPDAFLMTVYQGFSFFCREDEPDITELYLTHGAQAATAEILLG